MCSLLSGSWRKAQRWQGWGLIETSLWALSLVFAGLFSPPLGISGCLQFSALLFGPAPCLVGSRANASMKSPGEYFWVSGMGSGVSGLGLVPDRSSSLCLSALSYPGSTLSSSCSSRLPSSPSSSPTRRWGMWPSTWPSSLCGTISTDVSTPTSHPLVADLCHLAPDENSQGKRN